ncbi:MAG: class I SAM-dependent methyltransferase, partial [Saprospiraceae bacterium]|nr:class I SAM-dependent methyltransferase [Saprospiraceae bacterium]
MWIHLLTHYRRLKNVILYRNQPSEAIFTHIYQKNRWADGASLSGTGSNDVQTQTLAAELGLLLKNLGATSILDIPCGDFHWMKNVDLTGIRYTGADIVEDLVLKNQQQYGQPDHINFLKLNLLEDPLPKTDVVLVRDCLVHFSYAHIQQALKNIKNSGCTYLLTTTFPEHPKNTDITTGN